MPTYTELMRGFDFGPWTVLPERGLIRNGETERRLEPLVMDVFVVLASFGGDVVSRDQLIELVWQGRPQMDDVINRCITALRKALGDNARDPQYIETVPRRGYRVKINPAMPQEPQPSSPASDRAPRGRLIAGALVVVAIALVLFFVVSGDGPDTGAVESLAVFEFDCVQNAGQTDDHLCFGFADQVITSLRQVNRLQIVRKRAPYVTGVGVDEDARVTGSIQIIGDQIRIVAQLESTGNDVTLWSDSFDSTRDAVFDAQRRVADRLRTALDPGFSAAKDATPMTENYAAADAFSAGRYMFQRRDHSSIEMAKARFEEAIELDPSFGQAWLWLGYVYIILPDYLGVDRQSTYAEALAKMDEGVQRDPDIRDAAGIVYGFIYHKQNQWRQALEESARAVNAATAGPDDFNWYSRVLASVGRMDESLEYARRALLVDPQYFPVTVSRMAIASFWVDDLDNARRYFELANQMNLQVSVHALAYSLYLMRTGQYEAAKLQGKVGLERTNLDSSWVDPVIDGIADPDRRVAAVELVAALSQTGELPPNVELILWVLLGETDRAMALARNAEAEPGLFEMELIFIDEFRDFRRHPEFIDFMRGVGMWDYWDEAGCEWRDDRLECP